MGEKFLKELLEILPEEEILLHEPMRNHTTFRVGGEAEYFLMPSAETEVRGLLRLFRKHRIPFFAVGNGSNLLIGDGGYDGAILHLGKNFSQIGEPEKTEKGIRIHVQAGALLAGAARYAAEHSLTGMEFAAGIPGSMGGAVSMNAGAYGGEMKQIVESVQILTSEEEMKTLSGGEMKFAYRHSAVQEDGSIILSVDLLLRRGDKEEIDARMRELAARRREKQPLEFPSAGSIFKRPEGYFAGKLIMEAGLAGFQIGGARVSEKHCGFIVNVGDASARDIVSVIRHVQNTVMKKYAVMLEPEVRFAGRFD